VSAPATDEPSHFEVLMTLRVLVVKLRLGLDPLDRVRVHVVVRHLEELACAIESLETIDVALIGGIDKRVIARHLHELARELKDV
jgi:hypothetical protein